LGPHGEREPITWVWGQSSQHDPEQKISSDIWRAWPTVPLICQCL